MAEITPTPRLGIHTEFSLFGTTENAALVVPTPRLGIHTEFSLFGTTENAALVVPTPRLGIHTAFTFPPRGTSHHVGLVWQADHG